MGGPRHNPEQIVAILKQAESGVTTAAELCRRYEIREATYYRWKAKYSHMDASGAKKLKDLEEENRNLKHMVANLTSDNLALKDVLSKNW
jgi:putative transposase